MPVAVTCQCGQRFSAQDQLYGKQVKCPACGGPLLVPAPARAAPARPAAATAPRAAALPVPAAAAAAMRPGVKVACACGQAFLAPDSMRGKNVRCPKCGGPISIPAADDLMSVDPLQMGADPFSAPAGALANDPLAPKRPQPAAAPAPAAANQPPWLLIGLGGGAAALVLIIAVGAIAFSMGRDVAEVPAAPGPMTAPGTAGGGTAPPPAPAASGTSAPPAPPAASSAAPFGSGGSPAPPPSSSAGATTPAGGGTSSPATTGTETPSSTGSGSSPASAFKESAPAGGMGISFLPTAVDSWHNDERFRRRGIVTVGDAETKYGHYSWMTQLLPFLGHQKEYDQINFNQGLTDGDNLQVGGNVIPAFLNPLDDRQKWKGYPLQGLALTHFAGMAGIEDARNIVAASLPRSDPRAGVFGYDEVATASEITDGTSQTIMVVGSGTIANPWIMGGGATIRGAREPYFDKVSGFGTRGLPQAGTLAVMADGSVRFVSASVEPTLFRSMCTIHGAESVDLERAAAPFLLDSIAK